MDNTARLAHAIVSSQLRELEEVLGYNVSLRIGIGTTQSPDLNAQGRRLSIQFIRGALMP